MERRKFFGRLGQGTLVSFLATPLFARVRKGSLPERNICLLKDREIRHMVVFNLNHEKGSELTRKFLKDGQKILSQIPGVDNFQVLNQVSLKNDFSYGFSMVFATKADYDSYSNHPDHIAFVENRWKKEVSKFMEIDFKVL